MVKAHPLLTVCVIPTVHCLFFQSIFATDGRVRRQTDWAERGLIVPTIKKKGGQSYNWKPLTYSFSTLKLLFLFSIWPAIALLILLAGPEDYFAQSVAWLVLALCGLAFLLVIWPWLTTPNPVVSISLDGLHDRRQTVRPICWDDIAFVSYAHDGINLAIDLKAKTNSHIDWRFPFNLIPKRSSFHIVLLTLDTSGHAPLEECLNCLRNRIEMNNARGATFIKDLDTGGLPPNQIPAFKSTMENVLLTHPTWEKSPSHDVHVVVTADGARLIHAFLDERLFDEQYPDWDGSASTIKGLIDLAKDNSVQAIVIDPGGAKEFRIDASLFAALMRP